MKKMNRTSVFALALTLVFTLGCLTGCGGQTQTSATPNASESAGAELADGGVLLLKVNPEIAVEYDKEGLVTGVTARNDDALDIIAACTDLIGHPARVAVTSLVAAIGDAGYFVEEVEGGPRQITLEIEAGSALPTQGFLDEIAGDVRVYVSEKQWHSPVEVTGTTDYGMTDYVDTDYGPNSDGDTNYAGDTDYGPDNDGVTDFGTDYGENSDGITDYYDSDYGYGGDGVTDYDNNDDDGTDYGEGSDGVTDYDDYDDTDYGPNGDGATDYNDGQSNYDDTDYGPNNDGVTDYDDGQSNYDDTDYGPNNDGVTDYDDGQSNYVDGNSNYDDGQSSYDSNSNYGDSSYN